MSADLNEVLEDIIDTQSSRVFHEKHHTQPLIGGDFQKEDEALTDYAVATQWQNLHRGIIEETPLFHVVTKELLQSVVYFMACNNKMAKRHHAMNIAKAIEHSVKEYYREQFEEKILSCVDEMCGHSDYVE